MRLLHPIPSNAKDAAAALYWQAFESKLKVALGPMQKGEAFVRRVLDTSHGISAHALDGSLLGVVGFKTANGALVGGGLADLQAIYGFWGGIWRAGLLHVLERDTENARFLLDGIFVAAHARSQGVGTYLLDAICAEGQRRGYAEIRLDVIDTNTRARALYSRRGFLPVKTVKLGPLRHVFGFSSSTTMVKSLDVLDSD